MHVPEKDGPRRGKGARIGDKIYLNADFELTDGEEELKQNG